MQYARVGKISLLGIKKVYISYTTPWAVYKHSFDSMFQKLVPSKVLYSQDRKIINGKIEKTRQFVFSVYQEMKDKNILINSKNLSISIGK